MNVEWKIYARENDWHEVIYLSEFAQINKNFKRQLAKGKLYNDFSGPLKVYFIGIQTNFFYISHESKVYQFWNLFKFPGIWKPEIFFVTIPFSKTRGNLKKILKQINLWISRIK